MANKTSLIRSFRNKIRGFLRELDKNEALRRRGRIVRNFFTEPPPRAKELVFESCTYEYPFLHCVYVARGRSYRSKINLKDLDEADIELIDEERRGRLFVMAGLSIAPHHFLLADFKAVRVKCGELTDDAARFYEEYFQQGLAEFRYRQGLNAVRPIKILAQRCEPLPIKSPATSRRALLLNGGGKDTCVMAELLKRTPLELAWLSIEASSHQKDIERASLLGRGIEIDVVVDPKVVADRVYPWGHMPTSGMLLSISMIPALAAGYAFIVTGNERSANEGNMTFRGMEINHQYTKSHAFESRFNDVVGNWLGTEVRCFSALRMFYDIQIAELIEALCKDYVGSFVSCNKGGGWCNDCEKCAFVYLALSPFMSRERLDLVFGEDLWRKPRTRALMLHLMAGRVKRWECVGTRDECKLAAALYFERNGRREFDEWPYLSDIDKACQGMNVDEARKSLLRSLNSEHNLPIDVSTSIEKTYLDTVGYPDLGVQS